MAATKPLHEQLAECEQWCAQRREEEYLEVATKGLRVLPEHHAELAKPLPGQTPQADGWLLRSNVIGFGSWLLLSLVLVAGVGTIFVSVFPLVQKTAYSFLYATLLTIPACLLLIYLPFRMILQSHELVFGDDLLVVRRRSFGYLAGEWRLPLDGEVRVGLAYRGVQVSRGPKSVGTSGQLSVVVASGAAEVAFGTHLDHLERARLAILIDHHFNGTKEISRGA
jgi:hypothetical protein